MGFFIHELNCRKKIQFYPDKNTYRVITVENKVCIKYAEKSYRKKLVFIKSYANVQIFSAKFEKKNAPMLLLLRYFENWLKIRCDQLKNKSSRRVTYGNPCYSIGSKANSIYFLNDRSVVFKVKTFMQI
jgi:hypothetical protein